MQERGRGSGGSGGGGAGVARPNSSNGGWPLGLQPLHMHIQMLNVMSRAARSRELAPPTTSFSYMSTHHPPHHQLHYLQGGEGSPFFLSTYTPSISSLSSSDLDTESTGSFFPERSTTLGTLIGIHSRSQRNQPTVMDNVLLQTKHMTKAQRLHACWCAFTLIMKCSCSNSGVNPSQESLSPYSLAHLLELERKAAHTQEADTLQCETLEADKELQGLNGPRSHHYPKDLALLGGVGGGSHPQSSTNTLFNDDGILPPNPTGAPSKVTFRQLSSSPTTSSYISTDWSAGVPIVRKRKHYPSSHGRLQGSLCPGFWKLG